MIDNLIYSKIESSYFIGYNFLNVFFKKRLGILSIVSIWNFDYWDEICLKFNGREEAGKRSKKNPARLTLIGLCGRRTQYRTGFLYVIININRLSNISEYHGPWRSGLDL